MSATAADPRVIGTEPRATCPLCGGAGDVAYDGLEDVLYGAPGRWTLRACRAADCGMLWLDPVPRAEEISKAYARYYTHDQAAAGLRGAVTAAYNAIWRFTGIGRARERLRLMQLGDAPPGVVLDVGCGDGARLVGLIARGWRAEGQEIDPVAADAARARGVEVHVGDLAALALPASRYDAVTLSHVIEHVPDPIATLRECRRLLKPDGRLVALTPNAAGLGRARYGRAWRGLEPPRHLQIFSPRTLARAAAAAGFTRIAATASAANAYTIAASSLVVRARQSGVDVGFARSRVEALAFQLWASARTRADSDRGDECVLEAQP